MTVYSNMKTFELFMFYAKDESLDDTAREFQSRFSNSYFRCFMHSLNFFPEQRTDII